MNSYSLKWWITIHFQNGCNNYSLVDVLIFAINIFPNKQTFHNAHNNYENKNQKKIINLSFKFKKYYFLRNIIIWVRYFLKYILSLI